jgi:recombination protein RecT
MACAQLGLEPDGVLGQAYLVPFRGKVQFIAGYRGLLTLARNSGEISSIQAHEVCQNDEFSYGYGLNEHLDHKPAEGERGEVTHFYAYAKFKDGGHVFEVMTRRQVEAVRDKSEGYRAFKSGAIKSTPWGDHFVEMGRKTAIRRISKYLPLSVQKAASFEDAVDRGAAATIDAYGEITIDGGGDALAAEETQQIAEQRTISSMDALAAAAGGRHAETVDPDTGEVTETQRKPAPARAAPVGDDALFGGDE